MRTIRVSWLVGVWVLGVATAAPVTAAVYMDDFNRPDAADLGANWYGAYANYGGSEHGITGNLASNPDQTIRASAYNVVADGASGIKASIDFRASAYSEPGFVGWPAVRLGINYTGPGSLLNQTHMLIQGTNNAGFFIAGYGWATGDVHPVPLTAGNWYRLTVEQYGGFYRGTLATPGGTVLLQETYTASLPAVSTAPTGSAYFVNWWGYDISSPAFDNFEMELFVPEPSTAVLLAVGGLLVCRRRR